jgi:hypothetical protein
LNVAVQNRFQAGRKPEDLRPRELGETPAAEPSGKNSINSTSFPIADHPMGRYILLWLLGIPITILVLIWAFGGLH